MELPDWFSRFDIPKSDPLIAASRKHLFAIGSKGHGIDVTLAKTTYLLAGLYIPHLNGGIPPTRDSEPAVRREADTICYATFSVESGQFLSAFHIPKSNTTLLYDQ